jgi:hypothetical protein
MKRLSPHRRKIMMIGLSQEPSVLILNFPVDTIK